MYIHTGLLEICDSADELAAVVAHEMAHINGSHLVNHLHRAYRTKLVGKVGGAAVGIAVGAALASLLPQPAPFTTPLISPEEIMDQTMQLGGLVGDAFSEVSIRGYKKELEIQADEHTVDYMVQAQYDPYAMIRLLKRLKTIRDSSAVPEEFQASALINKKPGLDERISHIDAVLQARGMTTTH
ncbi:MAG: M48 family metalloprotease [Candidatus Binatia bacterium]